ncbi:MAG: hypothetical protein R6U88_04550 [Candidatus Bipolaricaulota bacterium]
MRKPILILAAACLLGFSGWGQISGSWVAHLVVIPPPPALDYTELTLNYWVNGIWTLSSTSRFTEQGFEDHSFGISGMLGPLSIEGAMYFNPSDSTSVVVTFPDDCELQTASATLDPPAYKWAEGEATLSMMGAQLIAGFTHYAYPYAPDYAWPCCAPQTKSYTQFSISGKGEHFSITGWFADCCLGLSFSEALLELTDLSLCCGITHDIELSFSKAGFEYFMFTAESVLPLSWGITFDAWLKFTVDTKVVSITPRFVGIPEVCITIFADVLWDEDEYRFQGLEIHGWKLRSELGECSYVEFLTALDVAAVEETLEEEIFQDDEFEYIKLGLCLPGKNEVSFTLDVSTYFQPEGSLFGITRFELDAQVPLMANLSFLTSMSLDAIGDDHELSVGWEFTF